MENYNGMKLEQKHGTLEVHTTNSTELNLDNRSTN
jgi:hypothetical protein